MKGPQSNTLSLAKQLSILFAVVLLFVIATTTTTEAMRWNKHSVKETATASVADSGGNFGRTIEFLAFNDGAVGFIPQFE